MKLGAKRLAYGLCLFFDLKFQTETMKGKNRKNNEQIKLVLITRIHVCLVCDTCVSWWTDRL